MHIGEAEVTASVAVSEAFVVNAQEMENGGVQVVNVDAIVDGAEAEVIAGAVGHAALDAAAGQPHGEAPAVVVAAVVVLGQRALAVDGASELAAPDDQRVVEQPALFEVFDQRGARLVGVAALDFKLRRQIEPSSPLPLSSIPILEIICI